jgi:hypothetical protein
MTLHTVGPTDMADDEQTIGRGYQAWLTPIYFGAPFVAAHYVDTKWVIAGGVGATLVLLHEAAGRLHDICIRLRRTNLMLSQAHTPGKDWLDDPVDIEGH